MIKQLKGLPVDFLLVKSVRKGIAIPRKLPTPKTNKQINKNNKAERQKKCGKFNPHNIDVEYKSACPI